jgi:RimJ/RimL family protein N-acetyltransferase
MIPAVGLPYTFSEPLRTPRLVIRAITLDDVDDLHAYQSDPETCRYLPFAPRSRDEVVEKAEKFSKALTLAGDGDFWLLAIERAEAPGVIGDLYFCLKGAGAEIGWTLHPGHAGRGYMTEAAGALIGLAFGTLERHRVFAQLDARNTASAALCRRLGMRHEAHFVEEQWFKGEWSDTAIYAILDREWRAR